MVKASEGEEEKVEQKSWSHYCSMLAVWLSVTERAGEKKMLLCYYSAAVLNLSQSQKCMSYSIAQSPCQVDKTGKANLWLAPH